MRSQEQSLPSVEFNPDDPFIQEGEQLLYIASHKINIYIC